MPKLVARPGHRRARRIARRRVSNRMRVKRVFFGALYAAPPALIISLVAFGPMPWPFLLFLLFLVPYEVFHYIIVVDDNDKLTEYRHVAAARLRKQRAARRQLRTGNLIEISDHLTDLFSQRLREIGIMDWQFPEDRQQEILWNLRDIDELLIDERCDPQARKQLMIVAARRIDNYLVADREASRINALKQAARAELEAPAAAALAASEEEIRRQSTEAYRDAVRALTGKV